MEDITIEIQTDRCFPLQEAAWMYSEELGPDRWKETDTQTDRKTVDGTNLFQAITYGCAHLMNVPINVFESSWAVQSLIYQL